MRNVFFAVLVLVTPSACRAEGEPKATGILEGKKVTFPDQSLADGAKATIGLLESCHDESPFQAAEFRKAQKGDHVRLEFAKPVTVKVTRDSVKVSELVFRVPINTGVFWVRSGDNWKRYTKFEFQKQKPFEAWLKKARPAD